MFYLYVLVHNDKPLYVGFSGSLRERYKQHCTDKLSAAYNYINTLPGDELPDLKIITAFKDRQSARFGETIMLDYFKSIGHSLLNYNGSIPIAPLKKKRKCYADFILDRIKEYHNK